MSSGSNITGFAAGSGLRLLAAGCFVLCAAVASAEPPAPPAPNPPPVLGADSPGFLDALNRWLEESSANFKSNMKDTQDKLSGLGSSASDAAKDAAKNMKDATDAFARLPGARVVTGRELCQNAPNGSPDCRAAADVICHAKGFGSGKSLDTQSAQKCPARLWLSGRLPAEGECPTETHVVRAVCQ